MMKKFIKAISYVVLLIAACIGILYVFGPYEDSDLTMTFDPAQLEGGVDTYLSKAEARFADITPGVQKQVIWAAEAERKAPWSVLYLHGFSATAQEIRPVPDNVAQALGANLVLTRLAGHGRSGDAMAEATVQDWVNDTAEGLAIARKTGGRVLILSTSTGGTLAAAAAVDAAQMDQVAGIVLISPNFGVNNPLAPLLTWPAARYWVPIIGGAERSFEPHNAGQAAFWTTRYPSVSALPMAALVQEVVALDFSRADVPALFLYATTDTVVLPEKTAEVVERWGGPVQIINPTLGPQDDPSHHVIAGDIMSPGQTEITVNRILDWVEGL